MTSSGNQAVAPFHTRPLRVIDSGLSDRRAQEMGPKRMIPETIVPGTQWEKARKSRYRDSIRESAMGAT
jgi:hypothetical protein